MFAEPVQYQCQCQGVRRAPWRTLILAMIMGVLYAAGHMLFGSLIFDKEAILNGQIWRFLTGHFVHCNFEHFFWDMAAFMILGSVIEFNTPHRLVPSLVASCFFVSLWLMLGEKHLTTYCGLSGALNGLLVVAAILQWQRFHNKIFFLVLLAAFIKIIFELTTHQTIFCDLSSQSVPTSHLAGYIGGVIFYFSQPRRSTP